MGPGDALAMKILVLDNDWTERTLIEQTLLQNGHEILAVGKSAEALEMLQMGEIRFVIADRASTDMDGERFVQRLREADPPFYIYILLLTPDFPETNLAVVTAGADDFLRKPFDFLGLQSRLQVGERILGMSDHLTVAKDTLERVAMFDTLTGALNQRAFVRYSHGELERARRAQVPLSLIALDIDNFKSIKEKFGENIGNDVLTVVARGIREKSRPYDGVGRYEADTFLLILPGVISQDAERIAGRILSTVLNTEISLLDGTLIHVKLSAGIASSIHITASTEIQLLIDKSIEALSQAKREGGNRVAVVVI
jgi:two-component system, cell cycle response regulator